MTLKWVYFYELWFLKINDIIFMMSGLNYVNFFLKKGNLSNEIWND